MNILNILLQQETMAHSLLVAFWATCVIAFYILITYSIFMGVKGFISNLVKKYRYE